jgi:hypothetical protein
MGPRIWCHAEPHPFKDHMGGVESSPCILGGVVSSDFLVRHGTKLGASRMELQVVQNKHSAAHAIKADGNDYPSQKHTPTHGWLLGRRRAYNNSYLQTW